MAENIEKQQITYAKLKDSFEQNIKELQTQVTLVNGEKFSKSFEYISTFRLKSIHSQFWLLRMRKMK